MRVERVDWDEERKKGLPRWQMGLNDVCWNVDRCYMHVYRAVD